MKIFTAGFNGSSLPPARASSIFRFDSTVDGAGNLIDTSSSNLFTYSEDCSHWTIEAGATCVANQTLAPDGKMTGNLATITAAAGILSTVATGLTNGDPYEPSCYIMKSSTTGSLHMYHADGSANGNFTITLDNMPAGQWVRIWSGSPYVTVVVPFTANASSRVYLYFLSVSGTKSFYIWGMQLPATTNCRNSSSGPGLYKYTGAVTKPRLDLAPSVAIPTVFSDLQGADGNRLPARSLDGSTQYYSRAYNASFNIFGSDFTFTMVFKPDATAYNGLFSHRSASSGYGFNALTYSDGHCYCTWGGSGGSANSDFSPTPVGVYNVLQVVRSSNSATIYLNGVAGNTIDATNKGTLASGTLYLGCVEGAVHRLAGSILYCAADNRALSATELKADLNQCLGLLSSADRRL